MLENLAEPVKKGLIDKLYGVVKSGYLSLQNFVGVENLADVSGLGVSFYGGYAKKGSLAWLLGCSIALAPEFYHIFPKIFLSSDTSLDPLRNTFFGEFFMDIGFVTISYGAGAALRRIVKRKK